MMIHLLPSSLLFKLRFDIVLKVVVVAAVAGDNVFKDIKRDTTPKLAILREPTPMKNNIMPNK